MEYNLNPNKLKLLNFSGCENNKEPVNDNLSFQDNNLMETLVEMFPLIPENLFIPLLDLESQELSDVIVTLSCKADNLDIMDYLMQFPNTSKNNGEYDSDNVSNSSKKSDEDELTSVDDDKLLAKLEEDNDKGLVLGRTFLKEAHKLFASKCGLDYLSIDSMPPEITEMNWQVPEEIMLKIYRAFFEELGIIETPNQVDQEKEIKRRKDENMTMREIQELEEAMANSIEIHRKTIRDSVELTLQINSLQTKYPQISKEELERVFISSNMDTKETILQLSEAGFAKRDWGGNPGTSQRKVSGQASQDCVTNAIQIQRLQKRIDIEIGRREHIRNRIHLTKKRDSQVKSYWREELSHCKQRLMWYEEQKALATAAQQSTIYGNHHLDLHGFTRMSALAAVTQRIKQLTRSTTTNRNSSQSNHLIIICGRGLHSVHGRSRLKPVIHNYLIQENIKYTQPYDGTFRVSINQLKNR